MIIKKVNIIQIYNKQISINNSTHIIIENKDIWMPDMGQILHNLIHIDWQAKPFTVKNNNNKKIMLKKSLTWSIHK